MKTQFSDRFNSAINAMINKALDISNDDLPPMPKKEFTTQELSEIAEYYIDLANECPFEKGMTILYNGTTCTSMMRIIEEPKFVKGEWLAVCVHPYAERAVQLPCNFMTRIVYRDHNALLDEVKVMRGGRS